MSGRRFPAAGPTPVGQRLRASTIAGHRSPGPTVAEFLDAVMPSIDGNSVRVNGVDRCWCGCKYWVDDRCIDCGGTEPEEPE